MDTLTVSRAYLSRKLTRPLPTKDGGILRTVEDTRAYMIKLSKDRALKAQWQSACALLLAEADVASLTRQIELALFYEPSSTCRKCQRLSGRYRANSSNLEGWSQ